MNLSVKEQALTAKRRNISLLISIVLHFLFLILFTLKLPNHEKPIAQKVTTISISLANKDSPSSTSPQTPPPKPATPIKNISKKIFKPQTPATHSSPTTPKEISKTTPESNLIQERLLTQEAKESLLEKEFFNSTEAPLKEELPDFSEFVQSNEDDLLFSEIESSLGDMDAQQTSHISSSHTADGIQWGAGENRKIKRQIPIKLPEELQQAGLKLTVNIQFTVLPDGIISSAIITKSTGNSNWDESIRQQFSRWTFEKVPSGTAKGNITIDIGY